MGSWQRDLHAVVAGADDRRDRFRLGHPAHGARRVRLHGRPTTGVGFHRVGRVLDVRPHFTQRRGTGCGVSRDTAPGEWSSLGWGARSAIVFPLGTTSVALIQIMTTGEVGVRRHRRVVATSALLCATLVGVLGAIAAALALVGRNVPALEGPRTGSFGFSATRCSGSVDRGLDRGTKDSHRRISRRDSHARWPIRRHQRGIDA